MKQGWKLIVQKVGTGLTLSLALVMLLGQGGTPPDSHCIPDWKFKPNTFHKPYVHDGGEFTSDQLEACPGEEVTFHSKLFFQEGWWDEYDANHCEEDEPTVFCEAKLEPETMDYSFVFGHLSEETFQILHPYTFTYLVPGGGQVTETGSRYKEIKVKHAKGCFPTKPNPNPGGGGGGGSGGEDDWDPNDPPSNDESCVEPAQANQGESLINTKENSSLIIPLLLGTNLNPNEAAAWLTVIHRIVTINTPEFRSLTGKLKLNLIAGNGNILDLYRVQNDNLVPYTLGSPINTLNGDHEGCGVHYGHEGWVLFGVIPKNNGTVTLEAEVDPDPDISGNGVATKKAQIEITVGEVAKIIASSGVTTNSPQEFPGHHEWIFEPDKNPDPGKHLVVFYKDVINGNFEVQNFDVDLEAQVLPASLSANELDEKWYCISESDSGDFNKTDTFQVKFQNPTNGGVYRLVFDLCHEPIKSYANLVLPLAGAEVKDIVANDLVKADAFAAKVLASYSFADRNWPPNGKKWFVNDGHGDYLGRPNSPSNPTVWLYNQINDSDGKGAVATWFGVPVRISKISNFMVAYGARKIGVVPIFTWISQVFGTWNDSAASKSWDAGWAVAGGADYVITASTMVKDIFDESDIKNQKLWPNPESVLNYVPSDSFPDFNTEFCSPGFTEMATP